jgi:hypothetical protein
MAIQFSTNLRNSRLDQIETYIGTSVTLQIFTVGAGIPANCGANNAGTLLASITLPSDWMAAASGGSKAKSGTWTDASADATGTAAYFRVFNSTTTFDGTTCQIQGTVGTSGTDMIVNSTSFVAGNSFTVNTFTLTDGNA